MIFLDEIGLENLVSNEAYTQTLIRNIVENGHVFEGYRGDYIYRSIGYLDLCVHILPNFDGEKEVVGLSSHVMGNNFWTMTVGERGVLEEESDLLSKCVFFTKSELSDNQIPIRLMHSDVIPSYAQGEKVVIQVVAFPLSIDIYENKDAYAESSCPKVMGRSVLVAEGHILSLGIDDTSLVTGNIKNLRKLYSSDFEGKKEFYCAVVETIYGDLSICFKDDYIKDEDKTILREGAYIKTVCVISGDVAIGEYQNGAVYDSVHNTKVLRDAFNNYDFSGCQRIFADNIRYINQNQEVKCVNKVDTIARLQKIATEMECDKKLVFTYLVRLEANKGGAKEYKIGCTALLLAYDVPANFQQVVFVDIDEENRINKLHIEACDNYKFSMVGNEYNDLNEEICLNHIKEGLDSFNVSKLIDILDDNAVFSIDGAIRCRKDYGVLMGLETLLDPLRKDDSPQLKTYIVMVTGYKDETKNSKYCIGKMGIALSFGTLEEQEALLCIQINREKKVSAIDIVQDNNYMTEEVDLDSEICKTDRRFVPVQTIATEDEWLEIYCNCINDFKSEDDVRIYYGMDVSCVMEVDNSHYIKQLKGREEIWATLEVIFNLGFNNASIINNRILYNVNSSMSIEVNSNGNVSKILLYEPE